MGVVLCRVGVVLCCIIGVDLQSSVTVPGVSVAIQGVMTGVMRLQQPQRLATGQCLCVV